MQRKCRECFRICKWLEGTDEPKKYCFDFLKPEQIISVVERRFRENDFTVLVLENIATSTGNQLALSLSLREDCRSCGEIEESADETITLIVQCDASGTGTVLFLRFGVEDSLCNNSSAVDELHCLLNDILESLAAADFLMSACPEGDFDLVFKDLGAVE